MLRLSTTLFALCVKVNSRDYFVYTWLDGWAWFMIRIGRGVDFITYSLNEQRSEQESTRLSIARTDANMVSLRIVVCFALFALATAAPKLEQCPGKSHNYNIFVQYKIRTLCGISMQLYVSRPLDLLSSEKLRKVVYYVCKCLRSNKDIDIEKPWIG